jgi:hypothetical protein
MSESSFSREIRKALEAYRSKEGFVNQFYVRKIVQNGLMISGLPDLIGCLSSRFIAIECKLVKRLPKRGTSLLGIRFSDDQITECERIIEAGGMACGLICIHENKQALIVPVVTMRIARDYTRDDIPYKGDEIITRKHSEWDVTNLVEYLSH